MAIAAEEVDAKMVEVLPVMDEGVLPVGAPMAATPATSIAQFLRCNPRLGTMKGKRDDNGLTKWLAIAIFAYLIFSPVLIIIPKMKEPAVVIVLWVIIGLLMLSKIEYSFRSELWFICLCRGVIVDFPKTDSARRWLCSPPVILSLVFLLVYSIVIYISLDPDFEFEEAEVASGETSQGHPLLVMGLGLMGLLFILLLAKATVDVEGATGTLSLNLMLTYFDDPTLLAHRGFTVVHFSRLVEYVHTRNEATKEVVRNLAEASTGIDLDGDGHVGKPPAQGKIVTWLDGGKYKETNFSWDEVHALGREPTKLPTIDKFAGAVTAVRFLKTFKNLDA